MNLFETAANPEKNWLPYDGMVHYFGKILRQEVAAQYHNRLLENIDWQADSAIIFGKLIHTKRKVAWYGDEQFKYSYSNTTKYALPWTKELIELRAIVAAKSGCMFNSCLLNLYHNGNEAMAWHSDGEKELQKEGTIASLSLGAERTFSFKHKQSKERISLQLEPGSLLLMRGSTQSHWLHRLPPRKNVHQARINLTFRCIVQPSL